jgi:hypothetical protein
MNGGVIRLEKKEKLKELIQEWSTVDFIYGKEEQYINELMKIYEGEYRHDYSIFFLFWRILTKKKKICQSPR